MHTQPQVPLKIAPKTRKKLIRWSAAIMVLLLLAVFLCWTLGYTQLDFTGKQIISDGEVRRASIRLRYRNLNMLMSKLGIYAMDSSRIRGKYCLTGEVQADYDYYTNYPVTHSYSFENQNIFGIHGFYFSLYKDDSPWGCIEALTYHAPVTRATVADIYFDNLLDMKNLAIIVDEEEMGYQVYSSPMNQTVAFLINGYIVAKKAYFVAQGVGNPAAVS